MKRFPFLHFAWLLQASILTLLFLLAPIASALVPDQLLLIVNKHVPVGRTMAERYAAARHVPNGRIVELDLPINDEIAFDQYDRDVVAPLRAFLAEHHLQRQVTCLVTFYGLPLRIHAKENTPAEKQELKQLQEEINRLAERAEPVVADLEALAASLDPSFKPPTTQNVTGEDRINAEANRVVAALAHVGTGIHGVTDEEKKKQILTSLLHDLGTLGGVVELDTRVAQPELANPATSPEQRKKWQDVHDRAVRASAQIAELQAKRYDPAARDQARKIAGQNLGLINTARLLASQAVYFETESTTSALDNELPLMWWNDYRRTSALPNPLNLQHASLHTPPVMMVSRIDGPDEKSVFNLIDICPKVEAEGLRGAVALDSRGIKPPDAYGLYDQKIRDLAEFLKSKTSLTVVHDDKPELFPPHSVKDVAVYCGWYSVRRYVPCCEFVPGAVGFHIASFELANLHYAGETGWVRGLMRDGVVGTLGPVAEPYLTAFPDPNEFFPLLMTGKLTLSEVYWKTTPTVSWMITLVGDPLYNPFKKNPPVKVEDLPESLRAALSTPATQPIQE